MNTRTNIRFKASSESEQGMSRHPAGRHLMGLDKKNGYVMICAPGVPRCADQTKPASAIDNAPSSLVMT